MTSCQFIVLGDLCAGLRGLYTALSSFKSFIPFLRLSIALKKRSNEYLSVDFALLTSGFYLLESLFLNISSLVAIIVCKSLPDWVSLGT